ncbi:hypothetical protein P154DRAFT_607778 [Amniculicola lignicola CBS 123094]|uniref:Fungal-specific transcription factor domain-containing protein n=1 Tax=Amniculicola lignicola CBS 123094 TaxID=1392246 RepID=A0A6A5W4A9_9PLEO|nr:hypothetical protein P154DRAFT_607778 [Amniculicola lignicola CBS 123094]
MHTVYMSPEPHLRPFRDTWLPLAFSDSALFYEILSHIALEIATTQMLPFALYKDSDRRSIPNYLALHSLALRSINQRIADPVTGLSDGVISTVLAFACFSHSAKDWKSYSMHMDGLLAIIKAKGGIHEIDHNRIVRLLLLGIDVSASCFSGTPRRFPTPTPLLTSLRSSSQELPWWLPLPHSLSSHHSNIWAIIFPHDNALAEIFKGLSATIMNVRLESDKGAIWQDEDFAKSWLDPLTYRLLESSVGIENIHSGNFLAECCRLGALILLAKVRRRFSTHTTRLIFTGLETEKLLRLLKTYADQWIVFKPMLIWVSFLGAIGAEGQEREWFCDLIRTIGEQLMAKEWDEILVYASNLLWVGKVLNEECERLRPFIERG